MASGGIDDGPRESAPLVIEPRTLFPVADERPTVEYRRVGLSTPSVILVSLVALALGAAGGWFAQAPARDAMVETHNIELENLREDLADARTERDLVRAQIRSLDDITRVVADIGQYQAAIAEQEAEIAETVAERRRAGARISAEDAEPEEGPEWSRADLLAELRETSSDLADHVETLKAQRNRLLRRNPPPQVSNPCPSGDPENCNG